MLIRYDQVCKTIENNPVFMCTFVLNKEPELVEVFTKFRYKLREEHNLLKEMQIKVYISAGTINQSVLKKIGEIDLCLLQLSETSIHYMQNGLHTDCKKCWVTSTIFW